MRCPLFVRCSRVLFAVLGGALVVGCSSLVSPPPAAPVAAAVAVASPAVAASAPEAAASAVVEAPRPPPLAPTPGDAIPKVERIEPGAPNRPYVIRGELFVPENADVPMREVGIASWYGMPFHGRKASTGERYDMNAMTAAHPTMPLPSYARVRNLANGREVVVRVNDRGPFHGGRIIDLSRAAARKLGFGGLALVEVERLTHDDIRSGAWRERAAATRHAAVKKHAPLLARQARSAARAVAAE